MADDIDDDEEQVRLGLLSAAMDLDYELKQPKGTLRTLMERSRADAAQALRDLIKADPFDGKTIRALQWKVTRYTDLVEYIREVKEGAEHAMDDMNEETAQELSNQLYDEPQPDE